MYVENKVLARATSPRAQLYPLRISEKSLVDVKPSYTAVLTVTLANGENVELSKTWEENGHDFDAVGHKWSYISPSGRPLNLLDLKLLDLSDGFAWCIEVTAGATTSDIPATLRDLLDYHWKIHREVAKNAQSQDLWSFFERDVPNKKRLQQRTEYHFGIRDSDYTVQIARVQNFRYGPPQSGMQQPMVAYEPRWCVKVFHRDWNTKLSQNANLDIGRAARWRADLQTWFPVDSVPGSTAAPKPAETGVDDFLEKLSLVYGMVTNKHPGPASSITDQFQGMSIG